MTPKTANELDKVLDRLQHEMPEAANFLGIGVRRQDWRPVWALAKEIQEGFNSGVRYPTKELRDAAWTRFNSLRNEASRRAESERGHLSTKSSNHRDNIFHECKSLAWSAFTDAIFFFDQTTVEQMKNHGRSLGKVMQYFKEHKHEMLGEDKKACHARIQETKESHDHFWAQYKQGKETRHGERSERIRANIEKNREVYRKTAGDLARFRSKADDLRNKISSSSSQKWTDIWSGWLSETESAIDNMEARLNQLDKWIEEGEEKLRG